MIQIKTISVLLAKELTNQVSRHNKFLDLQNSPKTLSEIVRRNFWWFPFGPEETGKFAQSTVNRTFNVGVFGHVI